jgi:hypothetical protein
MELETLRDFVEKEIASYSYECPDTSVGNAWSAEKVAAELVVMKAALVAPYWADVEVSDTFEQVAGTVSKPRRRCAVVADDFNGTLLVFDPDENEFMLAVRQGDGLSTIGVRGDAVGCFMAR